jgi:hypothetical protein
VRKGAVVTKRCAKCGQVRKRGEFRPDASCRDGLNSWCAACHVEATREWRTRKGEAEQAEAFAQRQAESERLRRIWAEHQARVAELQAERSALGRRPA